MVLGKMLKLLHLTINRIVMDSRVVTKCNKYGLRQGHVAYRQSSQTKKYLACAAKIKGLSDKLYDMGKKEKDGLRIAWPMDNQGL